MAGGIYNRPGDLQLTNVTLSGNTAPYAGGALAATAAPR